MPIYRRLPKRGFNNARFTTTYLPVNLKALEEKFESGARVDEEAIRNAGLANGKSDGVKILGVGKLTKKLTVMASAFSASAKVAIEAAGGSCEVIGGVTEAPARKKPKSKAPKEPKADSPAEEAPEAPSEDETPVEKAEGDAPKE
jgi:large subunit ribosomal protein L15